MDYNSYNESLDYLGDFLKITVVDDKYLEELLRLIEGSRAEKTVTIRAIYEKYMTYIKENRDKMHFIDGEKEMWIALLDRWQ